MKYFSTFLNFYYDWSVFVSQLNVLNSSIVLLYLDVKCLIIYVCLYTYYKGVPSGCSASYQHFNKF